MRRVLYWIVLTPLLLWCFITRPLATCLLLAVGTWLKDESRPVAATAWRVLAWWVWLMIAIVNPPTGVGILAGVWIARRPVIQRRFLARG